jgi:hypothetical protein
VPTVRSQPTTAPTMPDRNRGPALEPIALPVRAAAAFVGMQRSKMFELIQQGEVTAVRIGGLTLVTVESLYALIARHVGQKGSGRGGRHARSDDRG